MYKCVGVIDQTGSPLLVYSLVRSSFNQWVSGSIPGWVTKKLLIYLALVCLVIITGKVSGEGEVRSVTQFIQTQKRSPWESERESFFF